MSELIKILLIVNTTCIPLSKLNTFYVGFEIVNTSDMTIVFDMTKTILCVDGKRSFSWDLATQNGIEKQMKIKPNETTVVTWPLGEALFQKEGKYILKLDYDGITVGEKKVEIQK